MADMNPRPVDSHAHGAVRELRDAARSSTLLESPARVPRQPADARSPDVECQHDLQQSLPLELAKRQVLELESQLRLQNDELQMLRKVCGATTGATTGAATGQVAPDIAPIHDTLVRLSHDLRTPLATILAWVTVLQQPRVEPATLREAVGAITRSARRQTELLDRAVNSSQPRAASELPLADGELQGRSTAGRSPAGQRLAGVSVLLVDDEADLRESLSHALRLAGATVFAAGDAMEALTLLRVERPTVLVCDIEMPCVDGHQLMRRIRALSASSGGKVISLALTAREARQDVQAALDAGFQMHLSKAADAEILVSAIVKLAERLPSAERVRQPA